MHRMLEIGEQHFLTYRWGWIVTGEVTMRVSEKEKFEVLRVKNLGAAGSATRVCDHFCFTAFGC